MLPLDCEYVREHGDTVRSRRDGGGTRGAAAAVAGRPSSGATTSVRGSDEIGLGPSRPRRPTQSESPCHRDTEWAVKPRQAGAVGNEWDAVDGDRRSRRVSND